MTDKIQAFESIANSTMFGNRDVVVGQDNKVRLGNLVFSEKKTTNESTLKAFRQALSQKYGVFGEHAFDTTLGSRAQMKKSLRACDIKKTISTIEKVKGFRFKNEITRQLDTDPKFRELPPAARKTIRENLVHTPFSGINLETIKNENDLFDKVAERISHEIDNVIHDEDYKEEALGNVITDEHEIQDNEATGLKELKNIVQKKGTSVEDKIKPGVIGTGMQVNRSITNPIIFDKLKDNGVEPGYIYHHDWSLNDTRSLMMDFESDESRQILENLKNQNNKLKEACGTLPLREQIMLCGHAHPAVMSAIADYVIEKEMKNPESEMYKAFEKQFSYYEPENYRIVDENILKKTLFIQIRNAVLNIKDGPDYDKSPVFKHLTDRHILKLDYNENQRVKLKKAAHAGKFMRPERVVLNRKFGSLYRLTSAQKADDISAGAVTEALANDLSRIMGIPTQDLRIVRGKYSDGHPKIMLQAKYAEGYKDLEKGYIKNGRIVSPNGEKLEKLGKYKAFFLVTADRDGIGSRGQNKGFAKGKFFAIDPGHSLEGNGKYLEVDDNLTFKDTFGFSTKPRFNNFSIFDDDTRFAKLQGVINMRDMKESEKIQALFRDYRKSFDPHEEGISDAERALREKIISQIDVKEKEFNESLQKILNVSANQIHLYDDLENEGPAVQEKAIETNENLEKLTSPTTWVSKNGTVPLEHLQVNSETRVPWQAHVEGDSIVYHCDEPLSAAAKKMLEAFANNSGGVLEIAADGTAKLTVAKENRDKFFDTFSEKNVIRTTHPDESIERSNGGTGLVAAKNYKSHLSQIIIDNNVAPQAGFEIPQKLTVRIGDSDVIFEKKQYEDMIKETPEAQRPKSVNDLKEIIAARVNKGREIMKDVLNGNGFRHQATTRNVACLTLAFHAATMNKGEYNERGSFSVADPRGRLYQWLDSCKEIYTRTSTHAKNYHHETVDGHMNMPRGLDIPTGMGGLMGGMKTLHYFTIPLVKGQPRRLFLKTETHGIYNSTISAEEDQKSRSPGMQCRGRRSTDIKESILHCGSLATVFTRKGDGRGNRKEDFPNSIRVAMHNAASRLKQVGFKDEADKLIEGNNDGIFRKENGGIRKLLENMVKIQQTYADANDTVSSEKIAGIFSDLMLVIQDYADETQDGNKKRTGDIKNRIGNEVMLENEDFNFTNATQNI